MKLEKWRLLDLEYKDPSMNLAVEEAIPVAVGEGSVLNTVRFWRNVNAVVIGRFQRVEQEVNFEACKKYGTSIVRRFTGGGAVYHDLGNLNYAVSLRKNHPLVSNDILETSKVLSKGVIEGLRLLGLKAEHKPLSELDVGGKKISGMAGAVKWGTFFHHGTLLVDSNLKTLSEALNVFAIKIRHRHAQRAPKKLTTLKIELGRDVSMSEIKMALEDGFQRAYDIKLVKGGLTKEERELAQKLWREKYAMGAWNFGKHINNF